MSDLLNSVYTLESALKAQSKRLYIITQNIANKETLATTKGGDPYRRHLVFFRNKFNKNLNTNVVELYRQSKDYGQFKMKFDPTHPLADDNGYVKYPNVDPIIENADAKSVEISYESLINALQSTKALILKTIDIISKQ